MAEGTNVGNTLFTRDWSISNSFWTFITEFGLFLCILCSVVLSVLRSSHFIMYVCLPSCQWCLLYCVVYGYGHTERGDLALQALMILSFQTSVRHQELVLKWSNELWCELVYWRSLLDNVCAARSGISSVGTPCFVSSHLEVKPQQTKFALRTCRVCSTSPAAVVPGWVEMFCVLVNINDTPSHWIPSSISAWHERYIVKVRGFRVHFSQSLRRRDFRDLIWPWCKWSLKSVA